MASYVALMQLIWKGLEMGQGYPGAQGDNMEQGAQEHRTQGIVPTQTCSVNQDH